MVEFRIINMFIAKFIAIIANSILIVLVVKHTEKLLLPYKRILIIQIFIDLSLSIVAVLFQFNVYQKDEIYFAIMDTVSLGTYLPHYITVPCIGLITFFVYSQTQILPLHYIYRYLIICHNKFINYCQISIICLICLVPSGFMSASLLFLFWPNIEKYVNFQRILMSSNEEFVQSGKVPVFYAFEISLVSKTSLIPLALYGMVYCIVVYCSVRIIRKLKKLQSSSSTAKSYDSQTQFNKILFVQAALPFITNVVPIFLNIISTAQNIPLFSYANLIVWFLTVWTSAINPIFTMWIMKCYRKVVIKFFNGSFEMSTIPKTSNKVMVSTV